MRAQAVAMCVCWGALAATGQALSTGQGSVRLSGDNREVLAPSPVQVGNELEMAALPMAVSPPQFFLNYGTSGRYGPYALADGTLVGNKQAPYLLRLASPGDAFTLTPSGNTNQIYGPFSAANGATVTLGGTVMTVVRFPTALEVTLRHPGKINQMPLIGVAPRTPAVEKELYGLREKYVALANRVNSETADVEFAGVPRVHSRVTGNTSTPVVRTSGRDKQNALKGAELSAIHFLETLFRKVFTIHSQAITDGATYHFRMPPGDYLLCVMQRVKDPRAQGIAGSATAVWWTAFPFDGAHPLALTLTAENAITWREIFALDKTD